VNLFGDFSSLCGGSHGAFIKSSVASICHFFNVFFFITLPHNTQWTVPIAFYFIMINTYSYIVIHRNILFIAVFSSVSVISSNLLHDVHIRPSTHQDKVYAHLTTVDAKKFFRLQVFLCAFHNANTVSVKRSFFAKGQ
jgi:hypothetical protein